MSSTEVTN